MLFLFFSFLHLSSLQAATSFNKNVKAAYSEIFKLKIAGGRQLIQAELAQNPDNLAAILVANYPDFLQLIISQNPDLYEASLELQEERLEKIKSSPEKSPYKKYAQAEIKIQIALCQLFFDDEFKAGWNIRQAFLLLQENQKLYPDFVPNRKSLGILQFAIGSIPDSYSWILALLGMNADVKTGIKNLELAATTSNPFQQEASMLFQFISDMLRQHDDAPLQFFQQQANANPDNLLMTFAAISILQKNKKCDAALSIFNKRPQGKEYLPITFMHHMAADMYLFKGDYNRALQENNQFLKQYQGRHYVNDTYYKMFLAASLQTNQNGAQKYIQNIGKKGTDFVEEDQIALKYAENPKPLNLTLLKARLHLDGGYYKEAETVLATFDGEKTTNTKDKIEYFYRLGRVNQGLKKNTEARKLYLKTIAINGNLPYYFAPNAALQLGYMAVEAKDLKEAAYYFKKTLTYPKHEYKRSLDSKAKVALAAL